MSAAVRRQPSRPAALVLLLALAAPPAPPAARAQSADPARLVARSVEAMGGVQALRALRVTGLEFHSANFALGQEETPYSPPRGTVGHGRIVTDWAGGRRLVEQETRQVNGTVGRIRQVVADEIGLNEVNENRNPMAPSAVANVLRGMRLQPWSVLLRALDQPGAARALPPARFRNEEMDGILWASGPDTVEVWFDRPTGLPVVTAIRTDDGILGDRRTLTWYTRWQETTGPVRVKLPWQVDTEVNGRLQSHNLVTRQWTADPDPGLFAIPDEIRGRAQPASAAPPPAPIAVTLNELAPGVWRAEGGSHHSLVVDQGDRLVVVEAPQSSARSNAVLDTLAARFPGKPVGLVVNTHHHWDHAGGLRGYLARGVPVATHARNVEFVRGIAAARKTVAPDGLDRGTAPPGVTGVADTLTVGSGASRVLLVTIPSAHAEGILAAYLPGSRLLFVSDVLTPGANLPRAGSAEVVALARARGLAVDRVAGGHGGVAAWADVERAATAAP